MGIDENGLGASLGPLVVTAVVAEVTGRGSRNINNWNSRLHMHILGDSKQLIRHGDVRLGEAWARVLAPESTREPAELLSLLSAIPTSRLMARCPEHAKVQCWNKRREVFLAGNELIEQVRVELQKLRRLGIRPCHVLSRLVCTDELNARGQLGENRFLVDLHCMEELIVKLVGIVQQPLGIVCGKVGGMYDYTRHFSNLGQRGTATIHESAEASIYQIADIGEIKFVRDADCADPLVMLASLVGKYLRELVVFRIGSHFSALVSDIRKPSGYYDSVTKDFVKATAAFRRQSAFPPSCFERTSRRDT